MDEMGGIIDAAIKVYRIYEDYIESRMGNLMSRDY